MTFTNWLQVLQTVLSVVTCYFLYKTAKNLRPDRPSKTNQQLAMLHQAVQAGVTEPNSKNPRDFRSRDKRRLVRKLKKTIPWRIKLKTHIDAHDETVDIRILNPYTRKTQGFSLRYDQLWWAVNKYLEMREYDA